MPDAVALGGLAWPVLVALAWVAGEHAQRWNIPRVAVYAFVGFVGARALPGLASIHASGAATLLANTAFGLLLFEFGYRIDLRWFRRNPWLAATGVLDVALTFVAVYALCRSFGTTTIVSLLLAAIAAATSPASLTRVVDDVRGAGQVTERAMHLAAFNCLCALLAFKSIVGFWTFETSGDLPKALSNSAIVLLVSGGLGAAFASAMPVVLRAAGRAGGGTGAAFALAVILLVAVCHALRFSPLVASLAFGLLARHRCAALEPAQRSFGVPGELLVVFLFTYIAAAAFDWQRAVAGVALGTALVLVRAASKIVAVTLLARAAGTSRRQGLLTAVALSPLSSFAVLLLDETRAVGVDLMDAMPPIATATLLLLWVGPLATQLALQLAGEVQPRPRSLRNEH